MARPKLSEPKCRQLNLSLTDGELASIARRADAVGMRRAHFARLLLLDEQKRLIPRVAPTSNFDRLIYAQLSRLGNLLNQIVRHLHQTGDPLPRDLELLLKDIRQIIARGARNDC
jgi:hypothetical protein